MKFVLHTAGLITASSIGSAAPSAATETRTTVDVSRSVTLPLAPGGTVRVERTWGDVSIETWDNPSLEVVVSATSKKTYTKEAAAEARARLGQFDFNAKAASPSEVTVTGVSPSASLLKPFGGKSGVTLRYAIRMPRTSSLVLHHDVGNVSVVGVQGNVDIANDTGEVHLTLPLGPSVALETSSKIGDVSLNATMRDMGTFKRRALVGHSFIYQPPAPDRRVTVRVGIGSITISEPRTMGL